METTVSVNSWGMSLRACYVFAADRLFLIGGNLCFYIAKRIIFIHNFLSLSILYSVLCC